jgi:hypothetical protein
VFIGGYSIDGYLLMAIGDYFINGSCWILVFIIGYYINGY